MTPCRIRVDYRQSLVDKHTPRMSQLLSQVLENRGPLELFKDADGIIFANLSDENGSPTTLVQMVLFDPSNKERGYSPGDFSKLPLITPSFEDGKWIFEVPAQQ